MAKAGANLRQGIQASNLLQNHFFVKREWQIEKNFYHCPAFRFNLPPLGGNFCLLSLLFGLSPVCFRKLGPRPVQRKNVFGYLVIFPQTFWLV